MSAKKLNSATPVWLGVEKPWLAPLAGHTDLAFRVLCREAGADACFTEMVSAKGLVYGLQSRKGNPGTDDLLLTLSAPPQPSSAASAPTSFSCLRQLNPQPEYGLQHEGEKQLDTTTTSCTNVSPCTAFPAAHETEAPLVVQLFGEEASFLGKAVSYLRTKGFEWFDLNMGCSVPKVVRNGAGAALSKDLDNALAVAQAMLDAAEPGRVGFKFRLGWNAEGENYLTLARLLEEAGAAWLTLHPRYAKQGFSGDADWAALKKLRQHVNIPVIASGDLFTAKAAFDCIKQTEVSGVMFARGALQNPLIFQEYKNMLAGMSEQEALLHNRPAILQKIILRHIELAKAMPVHARKKDAPEQAGSFMPASLLKMRGAIPRYIKELPGSRAFRSTLATSKCWEDFEQAVAKLTGYNF